MKHFFRLRKCWVSVINASIYKKACVIVQVFALFHKLVIDTGFEDFDDRLITFSLSD